MMKEEIEILLKDIYDFLCEYENSKEVMKMKIRIGEVLWEDK